MENDQTNDGTRPIVGIIMGSDSDWPTMKGASEALDEFGIEHEVAVVSAHRMPTEMVKYGQNAHKRGIRVVIAYVLARLLIAWQGGPEWLMTVVYIYIAISFLMSVGLWLYGQNAVRKMAEQLNSVEND